MNASAIVYTSATGFTAQYATLLHHQTGLPLYRLEDVGELPGSTRVLYLGWLCAGQIKGLKKAVKHLTVAGVCAVGMAPAAEDSALRQGNRLGQLPLFYLRGGYAPARVRGIYRLMMAGMTAVLSRRRDAPSRAALEAIRLGADWVSASQLTPVLNWLGG